MKWHWPSLRFLGSAVIAAVVGAACGGAAAPTATPTRAPAQPAATQAVPAAAATATPTRAVAAATPTATPRAAATPTPLVSRKPEGRVTVIVTADAHERMDPRNYNHGGQILTLYALYDSLVWKDFDGNNVPGLASKWTLGQDNLTWEFTLRPGVRYHNGATVTMDDVLYSLETFVDPSFLSSIGQTFARTVDKISAAGPDKLVIKTKQPDAIFLMNVGGFGIGRPGAAVIPKAYAESKGKDNFKNAPVGTGPWKFKSIERAVSVTFEAFEDHWYEPRRPTVKELVYRITPEATTRVAIAKTGEADIINALPVEELEPLRAIRGAKVVETVAGRMWLGFAEQRDPASPFHDVRVRQAISHAIDWNAINKALLQGLGKPFNGVIEPGAFGHDPTLKNPYNYDPAKAKKLLAEAGHPNGFQTSFYTHVSYIKTMQAVQSYLADVGVRGEIKQVEDATHWATLRQNALNPGTLKGIFHHGYGHFSDAYFIVEGVLTSYGQYTTINVPEIDALYEKTKTAMDPKERARLFNQIQKMSLDGAYYVYGLFTPGIHVYGPRVESYRPLYGGTYEAAYTGYETVRLKR